MPWRDVYFQQILDLMERLVPSYLLRREILTMFREMRLSCPGSNNICHGVSLRKIREGSKDAQDEFDLKLKWVPDERSRIFLKAFAVKHNLAVLETENSVTLTSPMA